MRWRKRGGTGTKPPSPYRLDDDGRHLARVDPGGEGEFELLQAEVDVLLLGDALAGRR